MESSVRTKLLAGAGMVCISTTVGILYKASQAASGGFKYSTTSAICIAEFVKLGMSVSFHLLDKSHGQSINVQKAFSNARDQLSMYAVGHIYLLAILYMINNQLSFYIYMMVDPGTVFLFKAASTMIVAAVQCTFAGKKFTWEQWKAMMLQACGMIIVQYDPCKGAGVYSPFAYACLCLSTAITAISAARNEFLVKNFQIGLNVQNAVLYSGGVIFNLAAFLLLPNPNSKKANIGFFEGYDLLAIGVVCSNALIGIVITAVYKYADAVVKCIASDITAVLLIILSVIFFSFRSTLTMWCGVFTVTFAVHLYIDASSKAAASAVAAQAPPAPAKTATTEMTSVFGKEREETQDTEEAAALMSSEPADPAVDKKRSVDVDGARKKCW